MTNGNTVEYPARTACDILSRMSDNNPPTDKRKILIQFDSDPHASVFDRVVAIDAGADEVFSYGGVTLAQLPGLVHGAIFTRGVPDLKRTAIFIGGASVETGEQLLARTLETFFGPLRVSVMMDANGSNTTAAGAVISARKHLDLSKTFALVLGTGPVGIRAARLLAREKSTVYLSSRNIQRAQQAADTIRQQVGGANLIACSPEQPDSFAQARASAELLIAAGPAGVRMMDKAAQAGMKKLRLAIDLNAVPPLGLEGIDMTDKAKDRNGVIAFGALGVGGAKMKIHRASIARLFESNDQVLDAEAIYEIAKGI